MVLSLYDDDLHEQFREDTIDKLMTEHLKKSDAALIKEAPDGINLAKLAIQYSDGIVCGVENPDKELMEAAKARKLPVLPFTGVSAENTGYVNDYNAFYDKIISNAKGK